MKMLGTTLLSVLALAGPARADAYKCRTADGEVVISSAPCQAGSRTQAVQASEAIPAERKRQAEQDAERRKRELAGREAARAEEARREEESRRRQAADESARRERCLADAGREPDPQLRASLLAACHGQTPPPPVVVRQPVYIPVPVVRRHPPPATPPCPGGNCAAPPEPAARLGAPAPGSGRCRPVDGVLKCK